ncbi:quercetin 2,3-dioxygenase [Bacillus sp. NPDC077027]|uniref:quercetin 2,3-dioxygenase n=1 Tax=Bacillus sp. NPDC077027 TaxID=3390548 RepID=UPI003CFD82EF
MSVQIERTEPFGNHSFIAASGAGTYYVVGNQLVHVLAEASQTNQLFELVLVTGGKGAYFPLHRHDHLYETIFVLEGKLEVILDGKKYMVTAYDYIHIPPKTIHGYRMHSHKTRFISFAVGGTITDIYSQIGKVVSLDEWSKMDNAFELDLFQQAEVQSDILLVHGLRELSSTTRPSPVFESQLPVNVQSYVLEAGEGKRFLVDGQLHELIATEETTDSNFCMCVTEGGRGSAFFSHYHKIHTEAFYCLEGQMILHLNGEEICLMPGDFVYIPPNTVHSYRLEAHSNKFLAFLLPGGIGKVFEQFGESGGPHICPYITKADQRIPTVETYADYDMYIVCQD